VGGNVEVSWYDKPARILVFLLTHFTAEIWLKWWGDSNMRHSGQENGKYLGVYTVFQIMSLASLAVDARYVSIRISFLLQFKLVNHVQTLDHEHTCSIRCIPSLDAFNNGRQCAHVLLRHD
jgi:hypothetical protein